MALLANHGTNLNNMPELPEVETIRRTLELSLSDKEIESIDVFYAPIIEGSSNDFIKQVCHQKINKIDRVGKYLVFVLDNDAFISHLRMEGKYYIVDCQEPYTKHCHVIFHLNNGIDLRYYDTRKFGRMQLVDHDHYRLQLPLSKLGKEPFDIDPVDLYQQLKKSSRPIKDVLLDQSIILGIGNIYANEICFRMKIHPEAPVCRLSLKRVKELVNQSIEVLNEAIEQGGTTIHTFSANGIDGLFQVKLNVHGRINQPCPVCGGLIEKIKLKGRGTYYCKKCQRKKT